jgi:Skp family chaperone for outer membrane proteins
MFARKTTASVLAGFRKVLVDLDAVLKRNETEIAAIEAKTEALYKEATTIRADSDEAQKAKAAFEKLFA